MSLGSSPHTRGAHHGIRKDDRIRGIIPAYAGSTSCAWGSSCGVSDHPRIRGEHGPPRSISTSQTGSSPHTRGARVDARVLSPCPRIIPAYAGSTMSACMETCHSWDHPRIRGEHVESGPSRFFPAGSSPHTRGARAARRLSRWWCRIIPAYAGSTKCPPGLRSR